MGFDIEVGDLVMCLGDVDNNVNYFHLTPYKYYEVIEVGYNKSSYPDVRVINDQNRLSWYCGYRFDIISLNRFKIINNIIIDE